jgi:hypothetical protein
MLVLNTYMNNEGFAFPGQPKWAAGARMSVRTIQRHIAAAKRTGWIAVLNAGRGGKGWAFNGYRCCIPDDLQLNEQEERIADHIAAQAGGIDGPAIAVSSASSANADASHGAAKQGAMVPPNQPLGAAKQPVLVATQLWRTNSCSENSGSLKLAQEEARTEARVLSEEPSSKAKSKEKTSEPELFGKARQQAIHRQRRDHVLKYIDLGWTEEQTAETLKGHGYTLAEVRQHITEYQTEQQRFRC